MLRILRFEVPNPLRSSQPIMLTDFLRSVTYPLRAPQADVLEYAGSQRPTLQSIVVGIFL
jgi:hypothetical protein